MLKLRPFCESKPKCLKNANWRVGPTKLSVQFRMSTRENLAIKGLKDPGEASTPWKICRTWRQDPSVTPYICVGAWQNCVSRVQRRMVPMFAVMAMPTRHAPAPKRAVVGARGVRVAGLCFIVWHLTFLLALWRRRLITLHTANNVRHFYMHFLPSEMQLKYASSNLPGRWPTQKTGEDSSLSPEMRMPPILTTVMSR